jgi:hypothetical protein
LKVEAKLGELIKLEQETGRLLTQMKALKQYAPSTTDGRRTLKDYGLTYKDSSRAQKMAEHKDLIPVVVARKYPEFSTAVQNLPPEGKNLPPEFCNALQNLPWRHARQLYFQPTYGQTSVH